MKRFKNIILLTIVPFWMVACDSNQERAKKTIEERLSDSFAMSNRDLRTRVDTIVMASKDKDNIEAMNELGILSRTNNNNEQKRAIELLMTELRNAMETEELARKNKLQDQ
jgi:hypothetical protein